MNNQYKEEFKRVIKDSPVLMEWAEALQDAIIARQKARADVHNSEDWSDTELNAIWTAASDAMYELLDVPRAAQYEITTGDKWYGYGL